MIEKPGIIPDQMQFKEPLETKLVKTAAREENLSAPPPAKEVVLPIKNIQKKAVIDLFRSSHSLNPWILTYALKANYNLLTGEAITSAEDVFNLATMIENHTTLRESVLTTEYKKPIAQIKPLIADLFNLSAWQETILFDNSNDPIEVARKLRNFDQLAKEIELIQRFSPASFAESKEKKWRIPRVFNHYGLKVHRFD